MDKPPLRRHDIRLVLDEATETYEGTFDGLDCFSDPDRIGIKFTIGWRTLRWGTRHLTEGNVNRALTHLWGVYNRA